MQIKDADFLGVTQELTIKSLCAQFFFASAWYCPTELIILVAFGICFIISSKLSEFHDA